MRWHPPYDLHHGGHTLFLGEIGGNVIKNGLILKFVCEVFFRLSVLTSMFLLIKIIIPLHFTHVWLKMILSSLYCWSLRDSNLVLVRTSEKKITTVKSGITKTKLVFETWSLPIIILAMNEQIIDSQWEWVQVNTCVIEFLKCTEKSEQKWFLTLDFVKWGRKHGMFGFFSNAHIIRRFTTTISCVVSDNFFENHCKKYFFLNLNLTVLHFFNVTLRFENKTLTD